jgi:hypothetical protein
MWTQTCHQQLLHGQSSRCRRDRGRGGTPKWGNYTRVYALNVLNQTSKFGLLDVNADDNKYIYSTFLLFQTWLQRR